MESSRKRDYWIGVRDGFVESLDHPFIARKVSSDDKTFEKALRMEMELYNRDAEPLYGIGPKVKHEGDYSGGLRTGIYAGHALGVLTFGLTNIFVKFCRSSIRRDLIERGRYPVSGWEVLEL